MSEEGEHKRYLVAAEQDCRHAVLEIHSMLLQMSNIVFIELFVYK